jgi:hypothetical protein
MAACSVRDVSLGNVFPFVVDLNDSSANARITHSICDTGDNTARFYILFTQGGNHDDAKECIEEILYTSSDEGLTPRRLSIPANCEMFFCSGGVAVIRTKWVIENMLQYYCRNLSTIPPLGDADRDTPFHGAIYYVMFDKFHMMFYCKDSNIFFRTDGVLLTETHGQTPAPDCVVTHETLRIRNFYDLEAIHLPCMDTRTNLLVNFNTTGTCWVNVILWGFKNSSGGLIIDVVNTLEGISKQGSAHREAFFRALVGIPNRERQRFSNLRRLFVMLTPFLVFFEQFPGCAWIDLVHVQDIIVLNPAMKICDPDRIPNANMDVMEIFQQITQLFREFCNFLDQKTIDFWQTHFDEQVQRSIKTFLPVAISKCTCRNPACLFESPSNHLDLSVGITLNPGNLSFDVTTPEGFENSMHSMDNAYKACIRCGTVTTVTEMMYAENPPGTHILVNTPHAAGSPRMCLRGPHRDGMLQIGRNIVRIVQLFISIPGHHTAIVRVRTGLDSDVDPAYYYIQDGVPPLLTTPDAFIDNVVGFIVEVVSNDVTAQSLDRIRLFQRQSVAQTVNSSIVSSIANEWIRLTTNEYERVEHIISTYMEAAADADDTAAAEDEMDREFITTRRAVDQYALDRDTFVHRLEEFLSRENAGPVDPQIQHILKDLDKLNDQITGLRAELRI